MDPIQFVNSIYLGDRGCNEILIDNLANKIKLKIDLLSRVRGKQWDYYADEDVENGFIVFEDVREYTFLPCGLMLNDFIENFSASFDESRGCHIFEISAGSYPLNSSEYHLVAIKIYAGNVYIEDTVNNKIIRE